MTIEIHQPRLQALIQLRMASGLFQSVEDLLLQTLEASRYGSKVSPPRAPRANLDDFLMASPLPGSGLVLEREKQFAREFDL